MHWGNSTLGGDPFVAKKKLLFIQKVVRNRSVWGMGNLTILSFPITSLLSPTKLIQDIDIFCYFITFYLHNLVLVSKIVPKLFEEFHGVLVDLSGVKI